MVDTDVVHRARSGARVVGLVALLIVSIAAALVAGGVFIWRGPLHHTDICLMCSDQSVAVRTSARTYSPLAAKHFGVQVQGGWHCSVPHPTNLQANYFPVTCTARTPGGAVVALTSGRTAVEDSPVGQYLSGPWRMTIGRRSTQLECLPSTWRSTQRCVNADRT